MKRILCYHDKLTDIPFEIRAWLVGRDITECTNRLALTHDNGGGMLKAPPVNPLDYISRTSKISLREGR